jgi:RNA polymerase sigma-70 factor (ECF subfamily)
MADALANPEREWLERAAGGDPEGWRLLLAGHHDRLRRMVDLRLDPRLKGRIDPSDVLQEAYLEATQRLPEYLRQPDRPFYLWLRLVAGERLAKLHRHYLGTQMRDVGREVSLDGAAVPEASSAVLAGQLAAAGAQPGEEAAREEQRRRLQGVLDRMPAADREVLALRHYEEMSIAETALVLGVSEAAAAKRYLRALERLRQLLDEAPGGLEGWRP